MQGQDPATIVQAWQDAANARDIDRLVALSTPDIEVGGPRGSGFGRELLREWIARAGLTMETLRVASRGNIVVAEQRGVWRAPESGEVTGDMAVASVFRVEAGRVARVVRYDTFDGALVAAGMDGEPLD